MGVPSALPYSFQGVSVVPNFHVVGVGAGNLFLTYSQGLPGSLLVEKPLRDPFGGSSCFLGFYVETQGRKEILFKSWLPL